MHFSTSNVSLALLAMLNLVAGHGAITGAKGNLGGSGSAIGIEPTTPRDGTGRKPFQQDSTRFKGQQKDVCGETLLGGANNIETGTAKVLAQKGGQLPQISAGGQLSMTLHQVNGDGAGPYTCSIDSTGTGQNWQPIQVTTQVPGKNGNNGANAKTDLPLNVAIPAGQTCTGTVAGQNNVCIVRCENPARAGPFGGCVPVQLATAAGAGAGAGAGAAAGAGAGAGPKAAGGAGAGAGAGRQRGAGGAVGAGAAARAGQRGADANAANAAAAKFVAAADDDDDDDDEDDE